MLIFSLASQNQLPFNSSIPPSFSTEVNCFRRLDDAQVNLHRLYLCHKHFLATKIIMTRALMDHFQICPSSNMGSKMQHLSHLMLKSDLTPFYNNAKQYSCF